MPRVMANSREEMMRKLDEDRLRKEEREREERDRKQERYREEREQDRREERGRQEREREHQLHVLLAITGKLGSVEVEKVIFKEEVEDGDEPETAVMLNITSVSELVRYNFILLNFNPFFSMTMTYTCVCLCH